MRRVSHRFPNGVIVYVERFPLGVKLYTAFKNTVLKTGGELGYYRVNQDKRNSGGLFNCKKFRSFYDWLRAARGLKT